MDPTPRGVVAFVRSDAGRKWIKYSSVSVIGMSVSQIVIIIATRGFGAHDLLSNFLGVAISSIPAYFLNRAWVWGKHGKNHLTKEVLPFWAFASAGLGFSTLLVAWIGPDLPPGQKATAVDTLRVMIGNVAGFGILWVAKFFVLDKLLFVDHDRHHHDVSADAGDELPAGRG